eukprot:m.308703 g.308703  ORF g.308703 m.308703 type:complete len:534 (+) comp27414_c0_seq1:772-2373(+)
MAHDLDVLRELLAARQTEFNDHRYHPSARTLSRDLLLNVQDVATGHVCEVQLTLHGFMAAKENGGHAMYKVLRLVGRLEEWSSTHQGDAGEVGPTQRLCDGGFAAFDVTGSAGSDVIARLAPALSSPRCFLTSLQLNFVGGLGPLAESVLTTPVLTHLAPSLTILDANNCGAGGPLPPGLQVCTRLQRLHLGFNKFEGCFPLWIGDLTDLRILNLERCGLTAHPGVGRPAWIVDGVVSELEPLGRADPGVAREALDAAAPLYRRQPADGGNPRLSGESPCIHRLTTLSLRSNRLSGCIPHTLGNLAHVTHVYLFKNRLTGPLPASLGRCTRLQRFIAVGNQLEGPLPTELRALTAVTEFVMYKNALSGQIPAEIGAMAQLVSVNLNENALSGAVPDSLGELTHLSQLSLSNNALSGSIPASLGRLLCLTELDLHGNRLDGPVPPSLGKLARLTLLDLSDNALTGHLPATLGGLAALDFLYLHKNGFTGLLPASFAALDGLKYLKLRGNAFEGTLPPWLSRTTLWDDVTAARFE